MASEKAHSLLAAEGLQIGYFRKKEHIPVAPVLNFDLTPGTLTAVVGPNGVGKSTLLRTLSGMQPSLSGDILLKGETLSTFTNLQLAQRLSVVLTEPPASKNLSVRELVSLGRQPHTNWMGALSQHDKEIVDRALKQTETESLAHRKCFELSDGQLQRVAIARALAQDTPIIILDEPTTHLDLYHRAYILKLLRKLAGESGKTVLFSTHEIDLAIQLCDNLLVLTEEASFFDTPEGHIEQGNFGNLFPSETVDFDPKSKRFTIKK